MTTKKVCRRLTTIQLAERWGCSVKKLANARVSGDGPEYIKTGNGRNALVIYRLKDIVAWERAHRFKSTTDEKGRSNAN